MIHLYQFIICYKFFINHSLWLQILFYVLLFVQYPVQYVERKGAVRGSISCRAYEHRWLHNYYWMILIWTGKFVSFSCFHFVLLSRVILIVFLYKRTRKMRVLIMLNASNCKHYIEYMFIPAWIVITINGDFVCSSSRRPGYRTQI